MPLETPGSSVSYQVQVHPLQHEIEVELTLVGPVAEGSIQLQCPTWVPGDYEFVPYGREMCEVTARAGESGSPLEVRREGWQAYRIEGGTGNVVVRYRAGCSSTELSEACGIIDDRNGVLLGTRYLYPVAHPGPCRVTYTLPDGWRVHHPSGARPLGDFTWEYPSYEILLDTPVVMGAFDCISREVRGTTFYHVFLDRGVGYELEVERFVDAVARVASACHDVFGEFPFEDYTFIFSLNPSADWGLEHLTSTMIGLGPDVFIDPDQWAVGSRVCAHELFHAWNVRRLRPAPLGHLNLIGGSFTEGLWVAEGFTRYYEFLLCTRTGVYTPAQFFSSVVNYYRHLEALPAYRRVTADDSSLATYLNHAKFPGRVNCALDYYDQGMVIAFNLDAALRTERPGGSLDAAFREFYEAYSERGAGYTQSDLCGFFERLHPGLGALIRREAGTRGDLSPAEMLGRLGFRVEDETVPYLGIVMQDDSGPAIYGVLDTSPAGQSGLAAEDVVTTVQGYPYSLQALKWTCAHEESVTLGVLRGNQSRSYRIPVGHRRRIGRLTWVGSPDQAARIQAWLGQAFSPAHGQVFPLDFYENFHGIETVI